MTSIETKDSLKASPLDKLFKEDNIFSGSFSMGYNSAKGLYVEGPDIIEQIKDAIRREVELCSQFQGIVLTK